MNEMAVDLLTTLLRLTLFLSGFALTVQLVLWLGRPVSPRVHRIVWLLVLAQGWLWWRLPVTIPYDEPVEAAHVSPAEADVSPARSVTRVPLTPRQDLSEPGRDASAPATERDPPCSTAAVGADWPGMLLSGWLAGMIVAAGAGLVSYVWFLGRLSASKPAEPAWIKEWEALCAEHHVSRSVPLQVSDNVGPLLCLSPWGYRLVVPAALWQRLMPAERLSLLRHELAHLERHDLWKSMLVRLLVLPQWFNPLAWLAAGRFDEAAEWACDEAAQGPSGEAWREYAQALLQLDAVRGQYPLYHAAAWGRGLSVRVSRLLHRPVKEDSLMKRMFVLGMVLSLALVCLVRFELVAQEADKQPPVAAPPAEKSAATDDGIQEMPQDSKLNEVQRAMRYATEWDLAYRLDPSRWENLTPEEKATEEAYWLKQLSSDRTGARNLAIYVLTVLKSRKAVPGLLAIATDRQEKDNADRSYACRALGIVGDMSIVPELVPLIYHYNRDTRLWAQISLVRLTGQNFGRDVAAWARWWKEQGHTPPISEEPVAWATSPDTLVWADPKNQEESDRSLLSQVPSQLDPGPHFARERTKALARMARDRELFSQEQLNEMESLTVIADESFGGQAAWDAMKKLVDKYRNANRTGCSLVYLGQMDMDGRKLAYFEEAIAKHSDCFYGDGVQVGAFARFLLGQAYGAGGKTEEAKKLFEEIRQDYPEAIDHNGQLLVEQLPK